MQEQTNGQVKAMILSPLELAICVEVRRHSGITLKEIIEHIKRGDYSRLGVSTGHYSRASSTTRKLTVDHKCLGRNRTQRPDPSTRGRTAYSYYLTPIGEAAIEATVAYRKDINPEG